jgi:uncharacterized protein (DUF2147 family)
MKRHNFKYLLACALFGAASSFAQMTPVGVWHTVDDSTGEPRAEIHIVDKGGVLSGRIAKVLSHDPTASKTCDQCKDDRKGQDIVGLELIRGVKPEPLTEHLWAGGGKILDPENGKDYTVKMVPKEGGKKLQVRGYIGPFYRTQTWLRQP